MTCETCQELFSDHRDKILHKGSMLLEFNSHIAACSKCSTAYSELSRALSMLVSNPPEPAFLGDRFALTVLQRAKREEGSRGFLKRSGPWMRLAAASLLLLFGLGALIRSLPTPGPLSRQGVDALEALRRGGRLLPLDSGALAWLPHPKVDSPIPVEPEPKLLIVFREGQEVQLISEDGPGIAWRAGPSQRKRYLHELVELSETSEDAQTAALARQEISRVMGPAFAAPSGGPEWELALAAEVRREDDWSGILPMVERSALAFTGADSHRHLGLVNRAMTDTAVLVRDRFLPEPLHAWLTPEEGS